MADGTPERKPTQRGPAKDDEHEVGVQSWDEYAAGLRKRTSLRKLTDAEVEFLNRYLTDDRVVGVRFAESTVEVQVVRNRGEVDLPDAFGGRPVVVRDFPETPDPAGGNLDLAGDGSPGPLAELLKRFPGSS
jgi:hypothetical protein